MSPPWVQQAFQRLTRHLPRRRGATILTATGPIRIAIAPPSLQPWANDSGWNQRQALPSQDIPAGPSNKSLLPLSFIRGEFLVILGDLPATACEDLKVRVRASRSLRELWHLRPEVFKVVALHLDQQVAHTTMDELNRFFPSDALGCKPQNSYQPRRSAP